MLSKMIQHPSPLKGLNKDAPLKDILHITRTTRHEDLQRGHSLVLLLPQRRECFLVSRGFFSAGVPISLGEHEWGEGAEPQLFQFFPLPLGFWRVAR